MVASAMTEDNKYDVVWFVGVTVCTGCIAGCGQMHVAFRFACIGCAVENTLVSTCQHVIVISKCW